MLSLAGPAVGDKRPRQAKRALESQHTSDALNTSTDSTRELVLGDAYRAAKVARIAGAGNDADGLNAAASRAVRLDDGVSDDMVSARAEPMGGLDLAEPPPGAAVAMAVDDDTVMLVAEVCATASSVVSLAVAAGRDGESPADFRGGNEDAGRRHAERASASPTLGRATGEAAPLTTTAAAADGVSGAGRGGRKQEPLSARRPAGACATVSRVGIV